MRRADVLNVFDVLLRGKKIDEWATPTADVERATAEAIDFLGLPPQITLSARSKSKRGLR